MLRTPNDIHLGIVDSRPTFIHEKVLSFFFTLVERSGTLRNDVRERVYVCESDAQHI